MEFTTRVLSLACLFALGCGEANDAPAAESAPTTPDAGAVHADAGRAVDAGGAIAGGMGGGKGGTGLGGPQPGGHDAGGPPATALGNTGGAGADGGAIVGAVVGAATGVVHPDTSACMVNYGASLLWLKRFDGDPQFGHDQKVDHISVGDDDSIFASGSYFREIRFSEDKAHWFSSKYWVSYALKLGPDGAFEWVSTPLPNHLRATRMTPAGNLLIAGDTIGPNPTIAGQPLETNELAEDSGFLALLSPSGALAGIKTLSEANSSTLIADASSSSAGDIAIAGLFDGSLAWAGDYSSNKPMNGAYYEDTFIASFDPSFNVRWARVLATPPSVYIAKVAFDAESNLVVAGDFDGTLTFDGVSLVSSGQHDFFVIKYDGMGNVIWATAHGGKDDDVIRDLKVDQAGNIFIALSGVWQTGPVDTGNTLIKMSPTGDLLWEKRLNDIGSGVQTSIALSPDGAIVMVTVIRFDLDAGGGPLWQEGQPSKLIALKLGPQGQHVWSASIGCWGAISGLDIRKDGSIALGGTFFATGAVGLPPDVRYSTGGLDGFVALLAP